MTDTEDVPIGSRLIIFIMYYNYCYDTRYNILLFFNNMCCNDSFDSLFNKEIKCGHVNIHGKSLQLIHCGV